MQTVKKTKTVTPTLEIDESFIDICIRRLENGKRILRSLPDGGKLHIDRPMPFLIVYRHPPCYPDPGSEQLVSGGASYLIAAGTKKPRKGLATLIKRIVLSMVNAFGSFLLVEVWAAEEELIDSSPLAHKPTFQIFLTKKHQLGNVTVNTFQQALQDVSIHGEEADVDVHRVARLTPPGLPALIQPGTAKKLGCHMMGIEVRPVYRHLESGQHFPIIHRTLRIRLSQAYKRGFFQFTRRHTTHRPPHYHALGQRAIVKLVWDIDAKIAAIGRSFDLLLTVTPTNGHAAWRRFKRSKFNRMPEFTYRPLPTDPSLLKRRLYAIPVERIEDPTLMQLFSEQQIELDRKISLLADRGSPNFLYESLQLFGHVEDDLNHSAEEILNRLPKRSRDDSVKGYVNAKQFARHARQQIEELRLIQPEIKSRAEVRQDVTGLMVSNGNLLIGTQARVPIIRVDAALAHEVGTHIVTYLNGKAQPFEQLSLGLPGYEQLQEGLAVLAEYLVGGLSRPRLRLLAARVIAAHRLIDGASFVEVFRQLNETYGFTQRSSFNITMRIFRGGGFIKDSIYLRGLLELLEYLRQGGDFEILFIGKLALKHIPIIHELQHRHVLKPARFIPPYLTAPDVQQRLARARSGLSLADLIERKK